MEHFIYGMFLCIPYNFFFKFDCVLFMFHAKVQIRHCDKFPRTNQATSNRIIYINTQKCVRHSRSIKIFEIQQYIGFFVIAALLELFRTYVRPSNIRTAMRDY